MFWYVVNVTVFNFHLIFVAYSTVMQLLLPVWIYSFQSSLIFLKNTKEA